MLDLHGIAICTTNGTPCHATLCSVIGYQVPLIPRARTTPAPQWTSWTTLRASTLSTAMLMIAHCSRLVCLLVCFRAQLKQHVGLIVKNVADINYSIFKLKTEICNSWAVTSWEIEEGQMFSPNCCWILMKALMSLSSFAWILVCYVYSCYNICGLMGQFLPRTNFSHCLSFCYSTLPLSYMLALHC